MTWISIVFKIFLAFLLNDIKSEIAIINEKGLYAYGNETLKAEGIH